jgi:predicted esterase
MGIVGLVLLALLPGCPVNLNRVPGTTELLVESETGYKYYLYVPSWHNNESKWPVVVTCHGTNPFDTAWAQIHEWRGLAERYGLLVVAPVLKGTDSARTMSVENQIDRQKKDERAILDIVQKTINSLNGDPSRVYMVGWSGGGYAVYYTGLRHPKIFRALSVRMGSFDTRFMPDVKEKMDPYQPVLITIASNDLPGISIQCRKAYDWLEKQGMNYVQIKEIPGTHQRRPEVAFDFLLESTKNYSFVRINAVKDVGGDLLTVQFYAEVDPNPVAVIWDFGDGQVSNEASPQHHYAKVGTYDVKLTVVNPKATKTERTLKVTLSQ